MRLVHDAGSLVFVWEADRLRIILHTPDVHSVGEESVPNPELTPAERKVLPHLVAGLTNEEIALELGCSSSVVKYHLIHICKKLGARSRVAAAVHCVREGLVA